MQVVDSDVRLYSLFNFQQYFMSRIQMLDRIQSTILNPLLFIHQISTMVAVTFFSNFTKKTVHTWGTRVLLGIPILQPFPVLLFCYFFLSWLCFVIVLLVKIFIEGVLKNPTGQCKKIMPAILCLSKERTLINNCGILQKWVILLWQVVCYTYLWWYKSVSLV